MSLKHCLLSIALFLTTAFAFNAQPLAAAKPMIETTETAAPIGRALFYPVLVDDVAGAEHLVFQVRVEEQLVFEETHLVDELDHDGVLLMFASQQQKAAEFAAIHQAGGSIRFQVLRDGEPFDAFSYADIVAWRATIDPDVGSPLAEVSVIPANVTARLAGTNTQNALTLIDCRDDVRNCNCPQWANDPSCSGDPDGDGIPSYYDNCDNVANANQNDCDGDGIGDKCDSNSVKTKMVKLKTGEDTYPIDDYRCYGKVLYRVVKVTDIYEYKIRHYNCVTGKTLLYEDTDLDPEYENLRFELQDTGDGC